MNVSSNEHRNTFDSISVKPNTKSSDNDVSGFKLVSSHHSIISSLSESRCSKFRIKNEEIEDSSIEIVEVLEAPSGGDEEDSDTSFELNAKPFAKRTAKKVSSIRQTLLY